MYQHTGVLKYLLTRNTKSNTVSAVVNLDKIWGITLDPEK
jgi:hypothetical protein